MSLILQNTSIMNFNGSKYAKSNLNKRINKKKSQKIKNKKKNK